MLFAQQSDWETAAAQFACRLRLANTAEKPAALGNEPDFAAEVRTFSVEMSGEVAQTEEQGSAAAGTSVSRGLAVAHAAKMLHY